jgi:hypothetical protein
MHDSRGLSSKLAWGLYILKEALTINKSLPKGERPTFRPARAGEWTVRVPASGAFGILQAFKVVAVTIAVAKHWRIYHEPK